MTHSIHSIEIQFVSRPLYQFQALTCCKKIQALLKEVRAELGCFQNLPKPKVPLRLFLHACVNRKAIAIAVKFSLGGAFIGPEPFVFPRLILKGLKSAKLSNLGPTPFNIDPTWPDKDPK